MLQNAYFLAKIGADTAENEQHFAEICQKLATTLRVRQREPAEARRRCVVCVHCVDGSELGRRGREALPSVEKKNDFFSQYCRNRLLKWITYM